MGQVKTFKKQGGSWSWSREKLGIPGPEAARVSICVSGWTPPAGSVWMGCL